MSSPALRTWTREEFSRAAEAGVFRAEERLELLDGQIVTKMTQNAPHVACTQLIAEWLRPWLPAGHSLRIQFPLALSYRSQPEPDLAVVSGSPRDYSINHPTPDRVRMIVEVADSSIREDLGSKVPLYAQEGIPELWIVDLAGRRIVMHSQPEGREYGLVRMVHAEDNIAPPFAGEHDTRVSDLLP